MTDGISAVHSVDTPGGLGNVFLLCFGRVIPACGTATFYGMFRFGLYAQVRNYSMSSFFLHEDKEKELGIPPPYLRGPGPQAPTPKTRDRV